jgi:PAS domain S-box-containing protein
MNTNNNLNGLPSGGESNDTLVLLKAALDSSVSGIIITDNTLPDNPIIYCNKSFQDITGYRFEEIIGHNCRFLQGDDREQPQRGQLKEAVQKGENINLEIRNYTKSGELFWNELFVSPIRNNSGAVTHFVGVQHDVSRRKKAEEELRHERDMIERKVKERTKELKMSQEYLDSIVQTVRESLIVVEPDLKVLTVNEHFLRTFKVSRVETIDQELYKLGNGQWNIPRLKEMLEDILPTNNPVLDFEVEHDFPHIGKKLMLVNAYRVELEGQYKDRILLAIEDITERRAIEQRKDDFLSVASHELKTPLTTVKAYVQVMERMMHPESTDQFKSVVSKAGSELLRLNKLISELLDVSRLQSGRADLQREPFDLNKMIHDVADGLQVASTTHKITIDGSVKELYNGDESQLRQVVSNLISNAIKYSPDASAVEIFISQVSTFIKVSVTDHGMGISLNDKKKIFERFYRASNIQKHFPGMGIGLYVCEQIVKNHGGDLWVDTEEGKGSTFSFTLPLNAEGGQ